MSIFTIFSQQKKQKQTKEEKPQSKKETKPQKPQPKKQKPTPKPSSDQTEQIISEAKSKAREAILEAKDEAFKLKDKARKEADQILQETQKQRKAIAQKIEEQKEALNQKAQEINKLEARLEEREELTKKQLQSAQEKHQEAEQTRLEQIKALEEVSGLTKKEARQQILKQVEKASTQDAAKIIKSSIEKARREADEKARDILTTAMYAGATDYVPEYTVSTIKVPDEDTKARVIGKNGRNIRSFEKATGVDLDLDEKGVIKLSSFDSVRREIAKVALKRLVKDGRIHPTHIEEFVAKAKKDVNQIIKQAGEELCHKVDIYDLDDDLVTLLGRFKFRTSYGQNMVAHTLEETRIGMKLANEIGADVEIVKLGCLLHDIGKVINEDGSHVELGVKLLKKYDIPKEVIDTVAQHHEDEEFTSVESYLVYIADAISGSRPGARYENYEEYAERLEKLEEIAQKRDGVKEAYAIQAGREIRVLVDPEKLSDAECVKLAQEIKTEIKDKMTYPGTVTVNVIRQTRASAVAK